MVQTGDLFSGIFPRWRSDRGFEGQIENLAKQRPQELLIARSVRKCAKRAKLKRIRKNKHHRGNSLRRFLSMKSNSEKIPKVTQDAVEIQFGIKCGRTVIDLLKEV